MPTRAVIIHTPMSAHAKTAPLAPSEALTRQVERHVHDALEAHASTQDALVEVATGFLGSQAPSLWIGVGADGPRVKTVRDSWDHHAQVGWRPLPDPVDHTEELRYAAIKSAGRRADAASRAVHAARLARISEALAAPGTTREILYSLLAEMPGLLGVDHSAALLLPDRSVGCAGPAPDYVVMAELMFLAEGDTRRPEHLVGLRIPCSEGTGGLVEATLRSHRERPETPYHLYIPEGDGSHWRDLGLEQDPFPYFTTSVTRAREQMLLMLPLQVGGVLGFLALNWRDTAPIGAASTEVLRALREGLGTLLSRSGLFQVPRERVAALGLFAALPVSTTRAELAAQCARPLAGALGASEVVIGLVEPRDDGETLAVRGSTSGIDLDEPGEYNLASALTLAALAIRMRRPLVLAGGHPAPGLGAVTQWSNALMVNERLGLVRDHRMSPRGESDFPTAEGWLALQDFYKPTGAGCVYAAIVQPIIAEERVLGVLCAEFDRDAAWETYSGLAAEAFFATAADILAAQLALLPETI